MAGGEPLSLILIGVSAGASLVVNRFTPKVVLVASLVIMTGGFTFLGQVSGHGDYTSHVLPATVILGIGITMAFVSVTIAATNGVASGDSGVASGCFTPTNQVGGSLGAGGPVDRLHRPCHDARCTAALRFLSRADACIQGHVYRGGDSCAAAAVLAFLLLPRQKQAVENEHVKTMALSFTRCPGAPSCGYLARVVAHGRRT